MVALPFILFVLAQSAGSPTGSLAWPTTAPASPPENTEEENDAPVEPPVGLLSPIPETGGLPKIYSVMYDLSAEEIAHRAKARDYEQQIRKIRHEHFGEMKVESKRQQGIALLKEFADPAAFRPMIEVLAKDKDDVRLAVLDHFAEHGEAGQGALGWVAINDKDAAMRNEAMRRMTSPAPQPVLYLVDAGLRSDNVAVVNASASLASALNITQAIPLLIFAQTAVTNAAGEQDGDLAWIAIQTQRAYVQGLVPVVGAGSGGFTPIIGVVSEGSVLTIRDAVVISYRTIVHQALVNVASADWGQSTEHLAYNVKSWWDWYDHQYVPFKNERALQAELAAEPPTPR